MSGRGAHLGTLDVVWDAVDGIPSHPNGLQMLEMMGVASKAWGSVSTGIRCFGWHGGPFPCSMTA